MISEHKKEYLTIILIVIIAASILYWWSSRPMPVTVSNPAAPTILADEDFILKNTSGSIRVGSSSYEDVVALFPGGKNLGLSTLYRPKEQSLLFEFSKKTNILTVVHIEDSSILTSRKIGLGDSMQKVIDAYGIDYSSISQGKEGSLDMVYGEGNKIVVRIENYRVVKITIQHNA